MPAQQPMYHRIADDLGKRIESGELERGSQLPTELELREAYGASRNTIRDAIKRLTSQGLVETRQGQGTYVTRVIDPFVTVLSPDPAIGVGGAGHAGASTPFPADACSRFRGAPTRPAAARTCWRGWRPNRG